LENIIKKVLESEYRARKIMNEVEEQRKQAELDAEKYILDVKDSILLTLKEEIDKYKTEKQQEALVQSQKIMNEANEKVLLMQKKFEENKTLWVQEVFAKVIGG